MPRTDKPLGARHALTLTSRPTWPDSLAGQPLVVPRSYDRHTSVFARCFVSLERNEHLSLDTDFRSCVVGRETRVVHERPRSTRHRPGLTTVSRSTRLATSHTKAPACENPRPSASSCRRASCSLQ